MRAGLEASHIQTKRFFAISLLRFSIDEILTIGQMSIDTHRYHSYNTALMRQFGIVHLALLLVFSFARDPFFHFHEGHEHGSDEPGHEDLALAFHTHVEPDSSSAHHAHQLEIGATKTSAKAQPLSFFQFRPETPPPLPALMQERALLSPLVFSISKVSEPPPRAHDPPFVHSSIPRPPPA